VLELGSKTSTIEGITVFADHADPNQFWYLPGPVRLARRQNDGRAAFTLVRYADVVAGQSIGGGFLMFQVDLRLDPVTERRIQAQLSSRAPDQPRLAAVPFDQGTVECIALDLQGGGGTTAKVGADGSFRAVESILGSTTPSLDGVNSAAFSLTLSKAGAIILDQVFRERGTPVGVVYTLTYTALRPALDVEIEADLKRVFDEFKAGLEGQCYWIRAGIDAAFEKLVEDGAITIKVLNFSTAADRAEKENWALDFFKEKLLGEWFKPTLTPAQLTGGLAGTGGLDIVGQRAGQLKPDKTEPAAEKPAKPPAAGPEKQLEHGSGAPESTKVIRDVPAATSGAKGAGVEVPPVSNPAVPAEKAGLAFTPAKAPSGDNKPIDTSLVSFRLKVGIQQEEKHLKLKLTRSDAVQRTYSPQGFFGLFAEDLATGDHFFDVDLADPFFQEFTVIVEAPFDKERIDLSSADVALDYGSGPGAKHKDLVIDAHSPARQEWTVHCMPGQTSYTESLQYHFSPDSDWVAERYDYDLPALRTEDRTLLVHPFDRLGFVTLDVQADQVDWTAVAEATVALEYHSPGGWHADRVLSFTPAAHPRQQWKLRLDDPTARDISYQVSYRFPDGTVRTLPDETTRAAGIALPNPFLPLDVTILPLYPTGTLRMVFVDLDYRDEENDWTYHTAVRLDGNAVDPVVAHLRVVDPALSGFTYRLTFVGRDGSFRRLPAVQTSETLIGVQLP
jgi:hypothetical protein